MQIYNLPKKPSKRSQNPSRYYYNSITNLKFQHKPKFSKKIEKLVEVALEQHIFIHRNFLVYFVGCFILAQFLLDRRVKNKMLARVK
jgi:hypothetical protein